jgi:hypothetical protein
MRTMMRMVRARTEMIVMRSRSPKRKREARRAQIRRSASSSD